MIAGSLLLISGVAKAATLTVCSSGCDYISVQNAVNAAADGDTIRLLDAEHTESGVIIDSRLLGITSLTIEGLGKDTTIFQGAESLATADDRVLDIRFMNLTLRHLTIAHGKCLSTSTSGSCGSLLPGLGGAIFAGISTLTMEDVRLRDSSGSFGAGIASLFASVTLLRTEVLNNQAEGVPGEAGGYGSIESIDSIEDSTFDGNTARFGAGIGVDSSRMEITGSTFSNNVSEFNGAALNINDFGYRPAFVILRNSTLSANTGGTVVSNYAVNQGVQPGDSATWFINSTVTDNTTFAALGMFADAESGATQKLTNSIVAKQASGQDCSPVFGTGQQRIDDYNNIDSDSTCNLDDINLNSQSGVDPLLGPLQDNGGPTLTHGISSIDSPALDAFSLECGNFIEFDQRGIIRPQSTECDVGSFELDPIAALALLNTGINGLLAENLLNSGQANALTSKVDAASQDIGNGNLRAAAGVLGALINQLEDFVAEGQLPSVDAQALIATAEWTINAL
jgi:hypothetical protein